MLNANIILSGQPVDAIGSLQRGQQAAAQTNALRTQNDLTNLYRTQGAGILAGDPNSLNALAGIDPMAAMGMKQQQQSYRINEEQLKLSYENARLRGMELAATMDARTRQEEAAKLERGLAGAAFFYQKGDKAGYEAFLRQNNLDPASLPFEAFPAHAAGVKGAMDALTTFAPPKPEGPLTEAGKLKADLDAGRITPAQYAAELAKRAPPQDGPLTDAAKLKADLNAGRITQEEYEIEMARRAPRGETISVDPRTGQVSITRGAGVGDGFKPADPTLMIGTIDAILNDPALPYATGWLEWTQNIPGTGAKRFGTRADQLNGQAFLQAFESLKGAGQITEIEGAKATQAVGRLDTAQSAEDYAQALRELRELLILGASREPGTAASGTTTPTAPQSPAMPPPPSPEAIAILRGNNTPEYRQFFDEVFGPGAAARALGGN